MEKTILQSEQSQVLDVQGFTKLFDSPPDRSPSNIKEDSQIEIKQNNTNEQQDEDRKNAGTESEKEPSVQILNDSEFSSPARKRMMDSSIIDQPELSAADLVNIVIKKEEERPKPAKTNRNFARSVIETNPQKRPGTAMSSQDSRQKQPNLNKSVSATSFGARRTSANPYGGKPLPKEKPRWGQSNVSCHSKSSIKKTIPKDQRPKLQIATKIYGKQPLDSGRSLANCETAFKLPEEEDPVDKIKPVQSSGSVNFESVRQIIDGDNSNNIKVVIRIRPFSEREIEEEASSCIEIQDNRFIQLKDKNGAELKQFLFDNVSDEKVSQNQMFESIAKPIAGSCLQGYNGTIFAYGQTGAGKTYTIQGPSLDSSADSGIMQRSFQYIFNCINEEKQQIDQRGNGSALEFLVKASFLEMYNEQILDLLNPAANLKIKEDINKGVYVDGLHEEIVTCQQDMLNIIEKGVKARHTGGTAMNISSSRSHSVLTTIIESKSRSNTGVWNIKQSRFHIIDLAGSERQKVANTIGSRLKEACAINQSLSALGNVINSLVDSNRFIPYRDSKLTFLLRDSLGGNSKTAIIANISPSITSLTETISTLKFAQRAKLITNKAVINEDSSGTLLLLKQEIKKLKTELGEQTLKIQNIQENNYVCKICGKEDEIELDYSNRSSSPKTHTRKSSLAAPLMLQNSSFENRPSNLSTKGNSYLIEKIKSLEKILASSLINSHAQENLLLKQANTRLDKANVLLQEQVKTLQKALDAKEKAVLDLENEVEVSDSVEQYRHEISYLKEIIRKQIDKEESPAILQAKALIDSERAKHQEDMLRKLPREIVDLQDELGSYILTQKNQALEHNTTLKQELESLKIKNKEFEDTQSQLEIKSEQLVTIEAQAERQMREYARLKVELHSAQQQIDQQDNLIKSEQERLQQNKKTLSENAEQIKEQLTQIDMLNLNLQTEQDKYQELFKEMDLWKDKAQERQKIIDMITTEFQENKEKFQKEFSEQIDCHKSLQDNLDKETEKSQQLSGQLDQQVKLNVSLQDQLDQLEVSLSEGQKTSREKQQEFEEKLSQKDKHVKKKQVEMQDEIDKKLETIQQETNVKIMQKDSDLMKLKDQLAQAQSKKTESEKNTNKLKEQLESLRDVVTNISNQNNELGRRYEQEKQDAYDRISSLKNEAKQKDDKQKMYQEWHEQLRDLVEKQKDELKELNTSLDKKKAQIEELQDQLGAKDEAIEQTVKESMVKTDSTQKELEDLKSQMEELKQEITQKDESFQKSTQKDQDEINELKEINLELEKQNIKHVENSADYEKRIKNLENNIQEEQLKFQQQQTEIQKLTLSENQLTMDQDQLKQQLDKQKLHSDESQNKLNEMVNEKLSLEAILQNQKAQTGLSLQKQASLIDQQQKKLVEVQEKLSIALQDQVRIQKELDSNNNDLNQQSESHDQEVQRLQKQLQQKLEQYDEQLELHEKEKVLMREEETKKFNLIQQDANRLDNELSEAIEDKIRTECQLQTQKEELQKQLDMQLNELDLLKQQLESFNSTQQELTQAKAELIEHTETIKSKDLHIESLISGQKQQLQEYELEKQNLLKLQYEKQTDYLGQVSKAVDELAQSKSQVSNLENKLDLIKQGSIKKLALIDGPLDEVNHKLHGLDAELNSIQFAEENGQISQLLIKLSNKWQSEINVQAVLKEELMQQLSQLKNNKEHLLNEMKRLQDDLQLKTVKLQEQIVMQKKVKEDNKNEVSGLQQKIQKLQIERRELVLKQEEFDQNLKNSMTELDKYKNQIPETQQLLQDLNSRHAKTQAQLQKEQDMKNKYNSETENLKKSLKIKDLELSKSNKELFDLKSDRDTIKGHVKEIETQLQESLEEQTRVTENLKAQIISSRQLCDDLKNQLRSKNAEINEKESEVRDLVVAVKEFHEDKIQLEQQIKDVKYERDMIKPGQNNYRVQMHLKLKDENQQLKKQIQQISQHGASIGVAQPSVESDNRESKKADKIRRQTRTLIQHILSLIHIDQVIQEEGLSIEGLQKDEEYFRPDQLKFLMDLMSYVDQKIMSLQTRVLETDSGITMSPKKTHKGQQRSEYFNNQDNRLDRPKESSEVNSDTESENNRDNTVICLPENVKMQAVQAYGASLDGCKGFTTERSRSKGSSKFSSKKAIGNVNHFENVRRRDSVHSNDPIMINSYQQMYQKRSSMQAGLKMKKAVPKLSIASVTMVRQQSAQNLKKGLNSVKEVGKKNISKFDTQRSSLGGTSREKSNTARSRK